MSDTTHTFPIKRTPEQGHTAQCQAKALITCIENARDALVSDYASYPKVKGLRGAHYDFRILAQDNYFLTEVDNFMAEGVMECICPDDIEW